MNRQPRQLQPRQLIKQLFAILLVAGLTWGLSSCSPAPGGGRPTALSQSSRSRLAEVAPPFTLQSLGQSLEIYQPQVKILSPRSNQTLEATQIEVQLQVKDLPLFKDEELGLGPYLQVLLDNQPYAQVYDLSEPLLIDDLTPGTHTLRVFAVRPWHESFKNEGAFAQSTFHIFTPTPENNPNPSQPLLTYNYPQGVYGAEPVLLDFYLTNAPLHLVAREDSQDAIPDWKIRCTINGESFTFDRWEPVYLKGLKSGKNWVQLELLDENGEPLPNVFNNTVQLVTYEPGGSDTLARLTRGELTADAARKIVDPNYVPPPPLPEPAPEPEVILEPDLTQEPQPETMPPEVIAPPSEAAPEAVPEVAPKLEPAAKPDTILEVEPAELEAAPEPEAGREPNSASNLEPEAAPEAAPEAELQTAPDDRDNRPESEATPLVERSAPVGSPANSAEPPSLKAQAEHPIAQPKAISPIPVLSAPEPVRPVPIQPNVYPQSIPVDPLSPMAPEESLEAVQTRLKELFQPSEELSEPLPIQLEMPAPAQAIEVTPLDQTETQTLPMAPGLSTQPAEISQPSLPLNPASTELVPVESAPEPLATPNFLDLLNRTKTFFEGLRKRPTEMSVPFLAPLLEGLDSPETNNVTPSQPNADQSGESLVEELIDALLENQQTPLPEE